MAVREIGRDAVEAALKEFRRRGRKTMLAKYGGGPSTQWYIEIGSSHFDQQLVIRAAHEHQGLGRLARLRQLSVNFVDFHFFPTTQVIELLESLHAQFTPISPVVPTGQIFVLLRVVSERSMARDGGSA